MKTYYYYRTNDGFYRTTKLPKDQTSIIEFLTKEEYDAEIERLREEMERLAAEQEVTDDAESNS